MTQLGIFFDVPFIIITFFLIVKFREKLADWFMKIKLPKFLVYLIAYIPFFIIEENINCGAFNCQYTLFPFTFKPLTIFVIVLGLLVMLFRAKRIWLITFLFSLFGVWVEIFYGVAAAEFQALPIYWFIFFFIYVGFSYAYLVVVPLTILLRSKGSTEKRTGF